MGKVWGSRGHRLPLPGSVSIHPYPETRTSTQDGSEWTTTTVPVVGTPTGDPRSFTMNSRRCVVPSFLPGTATIPKVRIGEPPDPVSERGLNK